MENVVGECSSNLMSLDPYQQSFIPFVVLAFIFAFLLAFGVGANDVANSFGTSVGSKVLTLRQACILATIFEILGAILLGYSVSDTVRKKVFNLDLYYGQESLLILGFLSALVGGALWNLLATFLRLPVSGTHSIIGSVLGFHLVAKGFEGINYFRLISIVISWFASPLLSGAISLLFFFIIKRFILSKDDQVEHLRKFLPLFYGFTLFINLFAILFEGPKELYFDRLSWWLVTLISLLSGLCLFAFINWCFIPSQEKKLKSLETKEKEEHDDHPPVAHLFRYLQILTACFGSFAHGANDVSNAIGPLIAIFMIWRDGNVCQSYDSPIYLMLFGGLGICTGLWLWGRKVIRTIGEDLTKIVPSTGFTIEIGAATTVLLASKFGFPISTTHCKVGSVVFVGHFRETKEKTVDWKLFLNIALAWILTVPVSALFSALSMLTLKAIFLN